MKSFLARVWKRHSTTPSEVASIDHDPERACTDKQPQIAHDGAFDGLTNVHANDWRSWRRPQIIPFPTPKEVDEPRVCLAIWRVSDKEVIIARKTNIPTKEEARSFCKDETCSMLISSERVANTCIEGFEKDGVKIEYVELMDN